MLVQADAPTLEQLFIHADIDDVTETDDGEVALTFSRRRASTEGRILVVGDDLEDAVDQALTIIRRENTLDDLHANGLTDEDIDRLSDAEEAWTRGYLAAASEMANAFTGAALSAPTAATAAEPVESSALSGEITVPSTALEALVNGDGVAITLALIHPARIVLS